MVRVAVIGAGPAGLVTLKYLRAAEVSLQSEEVEAKLFEADASIGGTFRARTYEEGELVSSRQLTTFSDFRRKDAGDFLSTAQYLQYLDDYCDHFRLWDYINLNCRVTNIRKGDNGSRHVLIYVRHGVEYLWECDAIAICSGLHVTPNIAPLSGIENVPVYFHSSQFKGRAQFGIDKTVLILGSGETAADIAHLAVTAQTRRVVVSHRNGFHLAPKRNPNPRLLFSRTRDGVNNQVPIDVSRASLFDTMYVNPSHLLSDTLWRYYDLYLRWILWISWGTTHGSDQWVGGKPDGWNASEIFFNKSGHKIAPYIDAYWREKGHAGFLQWLRGVIVRPPVLTSSPTYNSQGQVRQIDIAPWPSHIDSTGPVHFRNNGRPEYARMLNHPRGPVKPDVVVFCTGYKPEASFVSVQPKEVAEPVSKTLIKEETMTLASAEADNQEPHHKHVQLETHSSYVYNPEGLVRGIWPRTDPSVSFIGFVRPNLGAIPPLAEMQAQLWVTRLLAPGKVGVNGDGELSTTDECRYRLNYKSEARVKYGVDHESYAYQLALDMGAAIGFWMVMKMGFNLSLGRINSERSSGSRNVLPKNEKIALEEDFNGVNFRGPSGPVTEIDQASSIDVTGAWYKLPLTWALGANFNTKFRMSGPWVWDAAATVMVDELWETVARRELFFGHFTLSIVPMMIFGPLSLVFFLVRAVVGFIATAMRGGGLCWQSW